MKVSLEEFRLAALKLARRVEDHIINNMPERFVNEKITSIEYCRTALKGSDDFQKFIKQYDGISRLMVLVYGVAKADTYQSQFETAKKNYLDSLKESQQAMADFEQKRDSRFFWVLRGAPGMAADLFAATLQMEKDKKRLVNFIGKNLSEYEPIIEEAEKPSTSPDTDKPPTLDP